MIDSKHTGCCPIDKDKCPHEHTCKVDYINCPVKNKPSPFISQNVWLKRLGLIILLTGMGYTISPVITTVVIILAVVTYFIKQIKDFIKSIWIS